MKVHPALSRLSEKMNVPLCLTRSAPDPERHEWLDRWMYLDRESPSGVFLYEASEGAAEWEEGPSWLCPERLLHEMMHVVCRPPGDGVHQTHELWLLMPYERVLAHEIFQDDPEAMKRILDFQLETKVEWKGRRLLAEFEGREESLPVWGEALRIAHDVGLLEGGRVSWKRADWTALRDRPTRVPA